jgi:hypothetical protein
MTQDSSEPKVLGPSPEAIRLERHIRLQREGVHHTLFFFSYSGAIIVEGKLSTICANLHGNPLEIPAPRRIGAPSLRPTPQLTFENVRQFFDVSIPTPFPLQAGTFPGSSTPEGATANCWFGPSSALPSGAPPLPADTLLVSYWGPTSHGEGENLERFIVRPFVEWLRVLTHQWWIGRSIEGVSGPLHFLAPLSEEGKGVGSPTPVARGASAGPSMIPLTENIWIEAARRAFAAEVPPSELSLEMDANYMLASHEFRSGIILACSAIEAARDATLAKAGIKLMQLKTSTTDLLKHLSVGFERVLGANLAKEDPGLFAIVTAFWRARGEAAHGKSVRWTSGARAIPIDDLEFGLLSDNLRRALAWIDKASAKPRDDSSQ